MRARLGPKPKRRVGCEGEVVGVEDERLPKRDEWWCDFGDLYPVEDPSDADHLNSALGGMPGPGPPRLLGRIPCLEHEQSPWLQARPSRREGRHPAFLGEEHLGHVPRHRHHVDREGWQGGYVSGDPADPVGTRFGGGDRQRRRHSVERRELDSTLRQDAGEGAGSAADVEDRQRRELLDDCHVDVEVGPIALHGVVERGEAGIGEEGVNHGRFSGDERVGEDGVRRRRAPATASGIGRGVVGDDHDGRLQCPRAAPAPGGLVEADGVPVRGSRPPTVTATGPVRSSGRGTWSPTWVFGRSARTVPAGSRAARRSGSRRPRGWRTASGSAR